MKVYIVVLARHDGSIVILESVWTKKELAETAIEYHKIEIDWQSNSTTKYLIIERVLDTVKQK